MRGIDTNILVRFLIGDDPRQARLARALIADAGRTGGIFVDVVVLIETAWVLENTYDLPREEVLGTFEGLLTTVDMVFQHADVIASAIGAARESGVELADCVIAELNRREGCETTLTVDRKASRLAAMRLLADR